MSDVDSFCNPHNSNFSRDTTIAIIGIGIASIGVAVMIANFGMIYDYFNSFLGLVELSASIITLINVYLLAKQKISNYWYGLVGVLLFGYLFQQYNLLSDMWLQWAFYAPLQVIGFIMWLWGPTIWDWISNVWASITRSNQIVDIRPADSMKITTMSWGARIVMAAMIVGALMAWAPVMIRAGASFPYADGLIMMMSIAASLIMLRKYLENWVLWIAVDVVAIPVYWLKQLYVTSGLYVIFLCLATYGLWVWWVEWKNDQANSIVARRVTSTTVEPGVWDDHVVITPVKQFFSDVTVIEE